ncbi:MAG: MATE family efflux transporter [candidate division Zixibacteria bacterium]|nr:MATE family efflux transporter [candidate division Zixibacteria bacterium]
MTGNIDSTKDNSPADYTEGPIIRSIFIMGAPSMLGFLSTHIYTMVDTWWVSQLPQSESAVAGLAIFNNIMWFVGSVNMMIGAGSVAIISRRYGEKRYDLAEKSIKETFLLKFVVGALFAGLGLLFIDELVYLAGARGATLELSARYGSIMFWGMPAAFVAYSVFTALRSVANPQMAMVIMLASTVLNMALDPLLIFGYLGFPALGVEGAAIASVVSYSAVLVAGIILFVSGKANVRLHLRAREHINLRSMIEMIRIGAPAWVAGASDSGMRLALTPLIALYGDKVLASYAIGMQVVMLGMMIVVGIGLGLGALLGQTLGAGKIDRARKTGNQSIMLSTGLMTALGIVTYIFARDFAGLYFNDPQTINNTVTILRIFALAMPFWGVWIILESLYVGVGMNKPTMVISLIHAWALQVPLAYVLVKIMHSPIESVWISMGTITAVTAAVFLWYYSRGQWLAAKV